MKKGKKVALILGLAASLGLMVLSGCKGIVPGAAPSTTTDPSLQGSVNHIIFLLQENHSFDSYFGKLNDYRASQGQGRAYSSSTRLVTAKPSAITTSPDRADQN